MRLQGAVGPTHGALRLDLTANRKDCANLIELATASSNLTQIVEGHVFFARFAVLERSVSAPDTATTLEAEATKHMDLASEMCAKFPVQTRSLPEQIEEVRTMLRGSTFYTTVSNDEMRAVLAAMATEFRGTGHWYRCANGHPYTIGECGMPMETSVCPQCGAPVDGRDHQAVEGATHARDLEQNFGTLHFGH